MDVPEELKKKDFYVIITLNDDYPNSPRFLMSGRFENNARSEEFQNLPVVRKVLELKDAVKNDTEYFYKKKSDKK